jgi:hypothetical protein
MNLLPRKTSWSRSPNHTSSGRYPRSASKATSTRREAARSRTPGDAYAVAPG